MKRLHVAIPLVVLSAIPSAFAATEFGATVPIEVVRHFVGNPLGGEGRLYSDILDDFPPFTLPVDFSVLASADMGILQRVILTTGLDAEAADAAITAAFTAEGWTTLPEYAMNRPQTGFVSAAPTPDLPHELCHDAYGSMSVSVDSDAGALYVNLNRNMGARMGMGVQQSCAEMIDQRTQANGGMRMGGSVLAQYIPRLVMPEPAQSAVRPDFFGGGGGGSSDDWETESRLMSDWSADEILEHFTTQVDAQGWASDSEVSGASAATASWTKTVDGMDLVGLLTIVAMGDDSWNMTFRVVRKNAGGANVRGLFR